MMVPIEVPIHKYFSEPQNYNPVSETSVFELRGSKRTARRRRRSIGEEGPGPSIQPNDMRVPHWFRFRG